MILVSKEILGVYGSNVWYAMTMICVQLVMKQEQRTHATLQIIPCNAYSLDQTMVCYFSLMHYLFLVIPIMFLNRYFLWRGVNQLRYNPVFHMSLLWQAWIHWNRVVWSCNSRPYRDPLWSGKSFSKQGFSIYLQYGKLKFGLGMSHMCVFTGWRAKSGYRRFCCPSYHGTSW